MNSDFGSRARSGVLWVVMGFGAGQILRLVANVVLAAILFEEVFALIAIVMAVMIGLSMFSDVGLRSSVIQNVNGDEPDFLNTVWTLQIIRGAILFVAALMLAWPISRFYGANDPQAFQLLYLIPMVALTALIDGFKSPKLMLAVRHVKAKEVAIIDFLVVPFHVALMLSLAWAMKSVYALAIAAVLGSMLHTLLTYLILKGPGPRLCLKKEAVCALFGFGKWIFLSTIFTFFALQMDRLILAGMFTLAEVGVYSIAASLAMIVPTMAASMQGNVLFPWYSRMLENGMPISAAFNRTRSAMMIFSSFLCVLLLAGAGSFFELVYDDRYTMGGVLLPVLALGAWFGCLDTMYSAVFLASGKPKWTALANACKVIAFGVSLVAVARFQLSIFFAAVFLAASEATRWLVCQWLGRRLGLRNAWAELGMLAFFLSVSLFGWWLAERAPVVSELHPFWRLAVLGCAVSLLFAPLFYRHVLPLLRARPA